MREFATPDPTVTITKTHVGEAIVAFGGQTFTARFDSARRGWELNDSRFSPSAKLGSIGKLFGIRRAFVAGEILPVLEAPDSIGDEAVARQARRILASMQEFGYSPARKWHVPTGAEGFEEGYQPRQGGDPIFHTIGQVAGVEASREETIEAIGALLDGRRPNLAPRHQGMTRAVLAVSEALAAGKRSVATDCGRVAIEGPILPAGWDRTEQEIEATWPAEWDAI